MESLTLDIIPMGRSLKGVAQQFVLPAATFTAAAHMLPGGGAIAEGVNALAQGGMAPLAHGAGEFLSGQAGGFLSNALPQAFGIQQGVTSAVTGAIADGVSGGGAILAQGIASVMGGKILQAGAQRALSPALEPLKMPLKLPAAKERELVALPESTQSKPKSLAMGTTVAKTSTSALALSTREAPKALNLIARSVDQGQINDADIERAKATGRYFSTAYKHLKESLKKGAAASADDVAVFVRSANQAMRDIDNIVATMKGQGINTDFATQLGGTLQGLKGQIARKRNETERQMKVMSAKDLKSSIPTIDTTISNTESSVDSGLYGFSDIDEAIRRIRRKRQKPAPTG
ncbi:MAG: hypothetical protein LH647_09530, partial [Leptolyngbyaceae cyanobacterium CAN_BIN12]|nr:hypothetical protein [Leptolyngbyaceae cyanobacterium CAN_BIN12]